MLACQSEQFRSQTKGRTPVRPFFISPTKLRSPAQPVLYHALPHGRASDTNGLGDLLLTWHYIRLLMREGLPSSASFDPNRAGPGGRYRLAAACSGGRAPLSKQERVRINHAQLPLAQVDRLHVAGH